MKTQEVELKKIILDELETEKAITLVKETFSKKLAEKLSLIKVEAPLFVKKGTGVNDDLNGIESPVEVKIKTLPSQKVEIVHSLAKWKRSKIGRLSLKVQEGVYTDMKAIRTDEDLDDLHSILVDQWDWEQRLSKEERTLDYLKSTVEKVYTTLKETQELILKNYPELIEKLPEDIFYIHSEELLALYPDLTSKEREYEITKKYGAVFLIGVGGILGNGEPHDGRAPDYDDWSTETADGKKGLNGDILIWSEVLQKQVEISSMGIRVSPESLKKQLEISKQEIRLTLEWHKDLIAEKLPYTIGGGIGQSRVVMLLLGKKHIAEVQCSVWTEEILIEDKKTINIL